MILPYFFAVSAVALLGMALPFVLLIFFIVVAAMAGRRHLGLVRNATKMFDFIIVIPAHNEEASIASTVRTLKKIDYPPQRFATLVVADNCTDNTEKIARDEGAIVWPRKDDTKRAKGFALEYAFERLEKENALAWDAVVVIDADTLVDANLLKSFCWHLERGDRWMQTYYSVSNPDSSWRTRLLTLALSLFNGVWLWGSDRLGLSVSLRGNGMCFSREAIRAHPWRAYGLAEDLEFSWWLRIWGERVRFVGESTVYGEMATSREQGAKPQRQRWEEGRRQLRTLFRGALLKSPHVSFLQKIGYFADLYMPALAKLCVWITGAFLALAALRLLSGPHNSLVVAGMGVGLGQVLVLVCYVLSPIFVWRLPIRHFAAIIYFPAYVLWKISLFFQKKPTKWVRTPRVGE